MSGHLTGTHVVQVKPLYVVTRQSTDVIAHDDPYVATALRFIRNHAGQGISVGNVIDQLGVSRRTLERRFFHATGKSILSMITACRLERAKRLLLETEMPSYRVAAAAGFGSVKTFNRVFRSAEGLPPGRFRSSSHPPRSLAGSRTAAFIR